MLARCRGFGHDRAGTPLSLAGTLHSTLAWSTANLSHRTHVPNLLCPRKEATAPAYARHIGLPQVECFEPEYGQAAEQRTTAPHSRSEKGLRAAEALVGRHDRRQRAGLPLTKFGSRAFLPAPTAGPGRH
jgi:hypothetical protein